MNTGKTKILVDVDVLEEMLEWFCISPNEVYCKKSVRTELREQITAARKAQESHRG